MNSTKGSGAIEQDVAADASASLWPYTEPTAARLNSALACCAKFYCVSYFQNMEINGLKLPVAFIQDLQNGRLYRERGCWNLIQNQNDFGEPLETELCEIFEDTTRIQEATGELVRDFCCISEDDVTGYTEIYGVAPGEIEYIWDFSKIVCFAQAGDGACFCFDFRENEQKPSIIWWADAYWQRVASNYEGFIRLFDIPAAS